MLNSMTVRNLVPPLPGLDPVSLPTHPSRLTASPLRLQGGLPYFAPPALELPRPVAILGFNHPITRSLNLQPLSPSAKPGEHSCPACGRGRTARCCALRRSCPNRDRPLRFHLCCGWLGRRSCRADCKSSSCHRTRRCSTALPGPRD